MGQTSNTTTLKRSYDGSEELVLQESLEVTVGTQLVPQELQVVVMVVLERYYYTVQQDLFPNTTVVTMAQVPQAQRTLLLLEFHSNTVVQQVITVLELVI